MATSSERPILSGATAGAADIAVGGGLGTGTEPTAVKARGFWEQAWRRFRHDRVALVGGVAIIVMILIAFVGTPIANHLLGRTAYSLNTNAQGFEPALPWSHTPTAAGTCCTLYVLGTSDTAGHDELLGMMAGAQISFEVAILATIFGVAMGVLLGMIAGFYGGVVDMLVSRATELVMALPLLLFAIAFSFTAGQRLNTYTFFGLFSPGVVTLVIVISVFSWFYPARIIRAQVLSLREKEFVEAARMVGASNRRILRSHLLPHLTGTIIVYSTLLGGDEHPVRGRPLVPGRRHPAGRAQLGQPDQLGRELLHDHPLADGVAGPGHPVRDARVQPAGRRPARRARSARHVLTLVLAFRN